MILTRQVIKHELHHYPWPTQPFYSYLRALLYKVPFRGILINGPEIIPISNSVSNGDPSISTFFIHFDSEWTIILWQKDIKRSLYPQWEIQSKSWLLLLLLRTWLSKISGYWAMISFKISSFTRGNFLLILFDHKQFKQGWTWWELWWDIAGNPKLSGVELNLKES